MCVDDIIFESSELCVKCGYINIKCEAMQWLLHLYYAKCEAMLWLLHLFYAKCETMLWIHQLYCQM